MKRIYNYGGQVEQGFLRIDLGQIPFYQYVSENIDYEKFQEAQQNIFKQLLLKIAESNQFEEITFNDKRLIFLVVKAIIKYPESLKHLVKGTQSMMEIEWIFVYQYLIDNYDKSLSELDSVIRFINLLIGYTYIPEHKFTKAQADEFNELSDICKSVSIQYKGILPSFVLDSFDQNLQIDENETITDVIDIEESPITKEQIEEQESGQEEKTDDAEVAIWKEAIVALQEEIALGGEPEEIAVFQEAIQALKEEIEIATGKPFNLEEMMELGGVAQKFSSPLLLQFEQGGMVHRFSSPLPQTPKFGGEPTMLKNGGKIGFNALAKKVAAAYKGKKVKPKYQKEYGKTYSATEAKEVGNKVAAKVYRAQQNK
jgi:hypothetical protein